MALSTMVFYTSPDGGGPTIAASILTRYANSGAFLAFSPRTVASDCMEVEWRAFLDLGYSTEMTGTLLASWKASTIRIYNATWKAYHRWCARKSVDVLCPPLSAVLGFLQDGLKTGLKQATLKK